MAKRKVKRKATSKKFNLTGYPEIDEFLKACFDEPVNEEDELFSNLKAIASTVGVRKTVIIMRHLVTKLFEYDNFYNLLMDDIETNLLQFDIMRKMSVIGDEPEIEKAHKNMMVMAARLDEFAKQMEETSGQKLRKKTKPMEAINVTKEVEKLDG